MRDVLDLLAGDDPEALVQVLLDILKDIHPGEHHHERHENSSSR